MLSTTQFTSGESQRLFLKGLSKGILNVDFKPGTKMIELVPEHFLSAMYLICNGKIVDVYNERARNMEVYHVCPRVLGGKGGFGSMLRAIGAQIEKTTNREACRDISGRRMRDVNNEKKLRDWLTKAEDREKEKEERRRARLERRKAEPKHRFEDQQYEQQKLQALENLDDALQKGLMKKGSNVNGSDRKRASASLAKAPSKAKKAKEMLGFDINDSDLDTSSDEESSNGSASGSQELPGTSSEESSSSRRMSGERKADTSCQSIQPETVQETGDHEMIHIDSERHIEEKPYTEQKFVSKSSQEDLLEDKVNIEPENESLELLSFKSQAELEALGLDKLKSALMNLGLKCGGTLEERALRLWSVRGLEPSQFDPNLLSKSKGKGKGKRNR